MPTGDSASQFREDEVDSVTLSTILADKYYEGIANPMMTCFSSVCYST